MNNLEQKSITSIEVAEMVEKSHNELLKDIRRYTAQFNEGKISPVDFFTESTYTDGKNETRPCYLVTKKGCEFIANKLTGVKGAVFTAKYINKFNDMEETIQKPKSPLQLLALEFEAIKEVTEKVDAVDQDLQAFKMDMPVLGLECDKITTAVKANGVKCLGGKESNAYQDKSLRSKVYSDIYSQLKREFGLSASYKAIKRSQADTAISVIEAYELPMALKEEIKDINAQMVMN